MVWNSYFHIVVLGGRTLQFLFFTIFTLYNVRNFCFLFLSFFSFLQEANVAFLIKLWGKAQACQ